MGVFSQACCYSGSGSGYSILPNLNKHVMGIRYSHRNFVSETQSINPETNRTLTRQQLNSLEIFGRFNLNDRLQLSVFLPFSFIEHTFRSQTNRAAGLGDMSFLFQYQVLKQNTCHTKKANHQLRVGLGTKLPTGEFVMNKQGMFNTGLQLGTGSIDFIGSVVYTYRIKKFGVNTTASYLLNTTNNKGYKLGNKIQTGTNFFYLFDVSELQLMPAVGINYEHQFSNQQAGAVLGFTGGDFMTIPLGFDLYYRQLAFSVSVSPAVMNRLNWKGENKNKYNIEAGVFYNFSTKQKSNTK